MPDLSINRTVYTEGLTTTFDDVLNANEQELEDGIEELDANQAVIENELHGLGTILDPASAVVMQAGAGLSVQVLNQAFYVGGRRYAINEGIGHLIVSVPSVQTSHVYLDKDLNETVLDNATYPDPVAARPAGTWYVGECTTDAVGVTAVDDSAADNVQSASQTQTDLEALEADIGIPYDEVTLGTIQARLAAIEAGGGPVAADVKWGVLERTAVDATTIQQAIDAGDATTLAAALAANPAQVEQENWDEDAVNGLETVVRLTKSIAPEFAGSALGVNDRYRTVVLIPGIMGHLSLGDANGIIDEAASDMDVVDFTNHRLG